MIGNTIPYKRAVIRFRLFIFPSRKKKTVDRVFGAFDVSKYHKARVVSESRSGSGRGIRLEHQTEEGDAAETPSTASPWFYPSSAEQPA
jgi:hypothetical protein